MSADIFHFQDSSVRSTVVSSKDGRFVEVRRGDFTWSAANRAAHPDVVQRVWSSLGEWHADLPIGGDPAVALWVSEPWIAIPEQPPTGVELFALGPHLSHFMYGRKVASEEELSKAITDFALCLWTHKDVDTIQFLRFLLGDFPVSVIGDGGLLETLEVMEHVLVADVSATVSATVSAVATASVGYEADVSTADEDEDEDEDEAICAMGAAMMGLTITPPSASCLPSPTFYSSAAPPLSFAGVQFKEEQGWGGEGSGLSEPVETTIDRKLELLDELLLKNPTTNLNAYRVLSTLVSLCQRQGVMASVVQRMYVRSCAQSWNDLSPVVARSPAIREEVARLLSVCT
jgi:hypothetical protein